MILKTITAFKLVKLHELLRLAFNNELNIGTYNNVNGKNFVRVLYNYDVILTGKFSKRDVFEVSYEEEITEDTKFDLLLELWLDDGEYRAYSYINRCIGQLKDSNTLSIHALINGKLELIWEREE